MVFLQAFGGIFSLLVVVLLGYLLAYRGFFAPETEKRMPGFVTNISLPPFLACTIVSSFRRDDLFHMLYGALAPLILMVLLFAIAYATARALKMDRHHFGLFCACVSNPNTIFIGIPVNMALFGEEAVPYVLLYYFASTFFFWTVGNYYISRDKRNGDCPVPAGKGFHWRRIVSAPMYGFLSGLFIVCMDIRIPAFIFQSANIVGQLTTPLALIFIGITLHGMNLKRLRPDRDMILALGGRMVLSPLLMLAILPFFNLPQLMGNVFVMQSSLPVLMQVAILSAYYNTDPEFGSVMVSLSTILCVLTVPFYMVIMV